MELEDFVAQTLVQIVNGTNKANEVIGADGAYVASKDIRGNGELVRREGTTVRHIVNVNFDVAITVVESDDKSKGAGLAIAGVLNLGSSKDTQKENQIVNRIQFDIPLVLPDDKKPQAKNQGIRYS